MPEDNEPELVAMTPQTMLVDAYEFQIGAGVKIGHEQEPQAMFMASFQGRLNNSTERATFNIVLDPREAWEMTQELMNVFEQLITRSTTKKTGGVKGASRAARRRRKK